MIIKFFTRGINMGKLNCNKIYNYLHKFENSSSINKEIINLSNKIENFCFRCNEDDLSNLCFSSSSSKNNNIDNIHKVKFDDNFCDEESSIISSHKVNYNPIPYLDHDILNKYLYLSDYLEKSFDKNKAIVYLNNIINSKNLTNASIVNKSFIDGGSLNRILNNKSQITKDIAIKLCFGLDLNYQESIDFLLRFGYILSILSRRDCLIRYGLEHCLTLDEIDYILEELNEKPLIK